MARQKKLYSYEKNKKKKSVSPEERIDEKNTLSYGKTIEQPLDEHLPLKSRKNDMLQSIRLKLEGPEAIGRKSEPC